MPNATLRANARTLPEAKNRRAFLGALIATGAAAAAPAVATAERPPLSEIDRRTLDLWNRRRRARAALRQIDKEASAIANALPAWVRPGPKYRFRRDVDCAQIVDETETAWPEVADIDHQLRVNGSFPVLARPSPVDLCELFYTEWRTEGLDQARRNLTQALVKLDARLAERDAEKERAGYTGLDLRSDRGWDLVIVLEDEIERHANKSTLAFAANALIKIQMANEDDAVLQAYRVTLRAIRPQLAGVIGEAADREIAAVKEA